jgi:DNA-binding winged helix-turn-helix (wHTH) protein/tetratricopeptide (TPR) repeat protein
MRDVMNRRIRFDDIEVDGQNLRVTVGSQIRPLEPKSFRLLVFLIENRSRVVPKDEIMAAIWPDSFVSENSLTRAVTQIRKVLGDGSKAPKYIETVPTVGYRFVATCLEEAGPAAEPGPAAPGRSPSRTPWRAAAVIGAAVVLAAMVIWFYSRKPRPLTSKDTVVLADFANSTGDPVFDDTLKQGLAVQLGQSPLLNILPDYHVRSVMAEMRRPPAEALTASVAREVCERSGSRAYITGSIANLGGRYVIGLNVTDCGSGDVLARDQIEARNKQEVISALGTVAGRVRKELGESFASRQRYDVPLAHATTPSLDALKAYSLGMSEFGGGRQARAASLFQQAVDTDPEFALAYANLGRAYQNLRQFDRMEEALRKAFELRNRTTERERLDISAAYHQFVTLETDEAIQDCVLWAQVYPLDFTPHRILGYENAVLGRYDRSAEEFQRARDLDPTQTHPYAGLMMADLAMDRLKDAEAVYRQAQSHGLEPEQRYQMAFMENDAAMMAKSAASTAAKGLEIRALLEEFETESYYGRLSRADEFYRRAESAAMEKGDKWTAADIESRAAFVSAIYGDLPGARQHVRSALRLAPSPAPALGPDGDPVQLALAMALDDELGQAKDFADFLESHAPAASFVRKVWLAEIRAAIELKKGDPGRAIEFLKTAENYEAGWYDRLLAAYLRGEAFLSQNRAAEAAAEFQKIIDHRGITLDFCIGALAHLGSGRSYAALGDGGKARAAYREFFELWKDADSGTPIMIAARSEFAKLKY